MTTALQMKAAAAIPGICEHNAAHLDVAALRRDYFSHGCVIIRGALDKRPIEEMERRFASFFRAILHKENIGFSELDDLDALHAKAANAIGPDRARHFLTMGRDFPAFLALISAPDLLSLLHALFETEDLQTISDSNVFRIDRPQSDATNLEWHQDYPYNMLAMNAATAWIPIRPVTGDMGRLQVRLPMSGLYPIAYDEDAKQQFHNSRYIGIQNLESLAPHWDREATTAPDMYPGDLLLLHALCLHKSGANRSARSRWVATARYGPFMDDALYERTWFTVRAKYPDIFKNHHPDLFRKR